MDLNTAEAIFNRIVATLRVNLRSSPLVEPGQPINLSLVPATPMVKVDDLINGALNLGWFAKDVIFNDQKPVPLPEAGNFDGDDLAGGVGVIGGQAFPPPQFVGAPLAPALAGSATPTQANVPGLLGQIFGSLEIPQITVRLDVIWTVRDRQGKLLTEGNNFIAPDGITSTDVSLLILPPFAELRLDTLEKPPAEIYCIAAKVTLTLGEFIRQQEVLGVPIIALPLFIPAVVAIGRYNNFSAFNDGATLFMVPEHSPLSSAEELNDELKKICDVLSSLTRIAKIATFLLGLRALNNALTAPYIGFHSRNGLGNLTNVTIGSRFLGLDSIDFNDRASSVLVIGLPGIPETPSSPARPGTKVQFYNDEDFDGIAEGSIEGKFDLEVGEHLFVLIRNLSTSGRNDQPKTFPNKSFTVLDTSSEFEPLSGFEPDDIDQNFNDSMTSVRFHPDWLDRITGEEGEIKGSIARPFPTLEGVNCIHRQP